MVKKKRSLWIWVLLVGILFIISILGYGVYTYSRFNLEDGYRPMDLNTLNQVCSNSFLIDDSGTNYCYQYIRISNNLYVTCSFAILYYGIKSEEGSIPQDADSKCVDAEVKICNLLSSEQGKHFNVEKTIVNNKTCKEIFSADSLS